VTPASVATDGKEKQLTRPDLDDKDQMTRETVDVVTE